MSTELAAILADIVGADAVITDRLGYYLADGTEGRGIHGRAAMVVRPADAQQTADVVAACYAAGAPIVTRGGGTGFAGGAVPLTDRDVVISTERLTAIREFDPHAWRIFVEAGVTTANVHRLALENGLYFPPDPGAAEQSSIGGNVATNAGGPHAFKYGVTGRWVTGLEVALPPGRLLSFGGPVRKDAAGLNLGAAMVGSEGALGIITAAWLRLIPSPEVRYPIIATFSDASAGCDAITEIVGSGLEPSMLEFVDEAAMTIAAGSFPWKPACTGFVLLTEADGSRHAASELRGELLEVLASASSVHAPVSPGEIKALWRWRDGLSHAVTGVLGRKISDDVAVPVDRLQDIVLATQAAGARHGVRSCSWGHAGDGNVHSSFLYAPDDEPGRAAAVAAADEIVATAVKLGGTISGEHGIGITKRAHLAQYSPAERRALDAAVKRAFDPDGLMNPGKAV